ncbi:hypothetical protein ACDL92_01520 [Ihubacter sp. mB4P-1]|uniref:hypothetical protein n=1 Tax=Ihubacter sp. mB4P-1 TaxID=3242370 RepID=UPI00137A953F
MRKSKLLSILLSMTLVITTVLAGTGNIFAGSITSGTSAPTSIEVQDINKVTEDTTIRYTAKVTTGSDNTAIIPITVAKAGTIAIPMEGFEVGKGVTASIHSTPAATNGDRIGGTKYISSSNMNGTLYVKVAKAGTYYLKFETASYSAGTPQSVDFNVLLYPAGGTLTKGKIFRGSSPDGSDKVSYYKVTVPGNGYLTVSFLESDSSYPSYSIKLANSKKNFLFPNFEYISSSKGYKTRIGVKKGTYYIAVKNSDKAYGMKVSYTSVKENSGTTKGKAKSIYKGNTKKGIINASQSSTSGDWYKFKITKSQYVKFNIDVMGNSGGGSGGLKFSFYQAGKNYAAFTKNLYGDASADIQLYTSGYGTKLAPGTYYIKVQKYSYGNGYYKIRWK